MTFKIIYFNFIQNHIFQLYSKSYYFNEIQNHIFRYYSKSYISIIFKIIYLNGIRNHIFERSFNIIYKSVLYLAVEKENIEIVKLLLNNDKLDINFRYIFIQFILIKFEIISFNGIQNHIFQ